MVNIDKGFFVLNKGKFKDNEDQRHSTLTNEQFQEAKEVKYIISDKHIMIDADSTEAVNVMEKVISMMEREPYNYVTKKSKGDIHKHYWFQVDEDARFIIDKYKLNSSSHQLTIHEEIDTRAYNTTTSSTGAVYLKMNGKAKANRPSPEKLLEELGKDLPNIPIFILLHKKVGKITKSGDDWSNNALKTIMMMKKDKWEFDLCNKVFAQWAMFNGDSHDESEIKHKWNDAYEIDHNGVEQYWKSGFKYLNHNKTKKGEEPKEPWWQAIDVKDYALIADFIIKSLNLVISNENLQMWGIENNVFKPLKNAQHTVNTFLVKHLGNLKPQMFTSINQFIKARTPKKEFEKNEFLITFKNKSWDVLLGKEVMIKENEMNQNVIPHNLISDVKNYEKEEKILKEFIGGWANGDKGVEKELYELAGLAMTKYTGLEYAYFLLGTGKNGKSWYIKLLSKMLGQDNISIEDLKDLSIDKFSSAELYGKLANINADISSEIIEDPSKFKKIVSGETINGEYKGLSKFKFNPYATIILGTNGIPYTNESANSDGSNRRIRIIKFNKIFKDRKTIEELKEMEEKLFSERVIELMIYKSLEAFKYASKHGFTTSQVSKNAMTEHLKDMNHLIDFIQETDLKQYVSVVERYKEYKSWAKERKYKSMSIKVFVKKYEQAARALDLDITKEKYEKKYVFFDNSTMEGE